MIMITLDEYLEAIKNILSAMSQLKSDGNNCAVCGDNGHQAWECHHNPVVLSRMVDLIHQQNILDELIQSRDGSNDSGDRRAYQRMVEQQRAYLAKLDMLLRFNDGAY